MKHAWVFAVFIVGCGGSASPPPPQMATPPQPAPKQEPAPPKGALWRHEVQETVNRGLGYFLQRVSVEADVKAGQFHGFRIVELVPEEFWDGVDLKPGDVVTRVNGMPIERDTEAYAAFESLRSADELRVTYLRQGNERELVYRILERRNGKVGAPEKPTPAAQPSSESGSPKKPSKPQ